MARWGGVVGTLALGLVRGPWSWFVQKGGETVLFFIAKGGLIVLNGAAAGGGLPTVSNACAARELGSTRFDLQPLLAFQARHST